MTSRPDAGGVPAEETADQAPAPAAETATEQAQADASAADAGEDQPDLGAPDNDGA